VLTLGCQVSSLCGLNRGVIFDPTRYEMRYLGFASEGKERPSLKVNRTAGHAKGTVFEIMRHL
jgi:hypothetical protein